MYVADISKANVLAIFLLPSNMLQLRQKFLDLQPGSRIVSNTFSIQDWTADEMVTLDNCSSWCTALLYIVPAKVDGTWRTPQGDLALKQEFQMLSGTMTVNGQPAAVTGRLRGQRSDAVVRRPGADRPRQRQRHRRQRQERQRPDGVARHARELTGEPARAGPEPGPTTSSHPGLAEAGRSRRP